MQDAKIITLDDLVQRDGFGSVEAWIKAKCAESIKAKKIETGWDGQSVEGEPVKAFINQGRWGARCKVCGNPFYVSYKTPVLYCYECGNGGNVAAYPVEFPENYLEIEAALLRREVVLLRVARNEIEAAFIATPKVAGLGRSWRPGVSVEALEAEREEKMNRRGAK